MSEMRDPVIKLFGRSILLAERDPSGEPVHCFDSLPQVPGRPGNLLDDARKTEGGNSPAEKSYRQDIASNLDRDEVDESSHQCDAEKNEEDANNGPEEGGQVSESAVGGGQGKALKKPEELLPCPRCNSLDTKFCYFNNYNANQPRHFCKNCQRYRTAGGAMRNVPVGAGRRKNRLSSPHRQVVVVTHNATTLSPDEHILFAGFPSSVSPLEGNEEASNLENGPVANAEEPSSSGGSLDASSMEENGFPQKQMEQIGLSGHNNGISRTNIFQPHPGFPWAYPWNSGWNTAVLGPSTGRYHDGHQIRPFPLMPVPMYFSPWINMQSMAAAASHWGYIASSDASSNSTVSGYSSASLGKHSREARLHSEGQTENCLWVPKTLRIHDPEEAAKSSIWNTLGIKPEKTNPLAGNVIFRSETKSDTASRTSSALDALQANPAALSRFQSFQEST